MAKKKTNEPRLIIGGRELTPAEARKHRVVAGSNGAEEAPPISELQRLREEKEFYKRHARLNAQHIRVLMKEGEQFDIPPATRQRAPILRKLLARGYTSQQIASEMNWSKRTVDYDLKNLGIQRYKSRRK